MLMRAAVLLSLVMTACAHTPLSSGTLDRIARPAFVSRIEEGAGPKATVFRDDSSYGGKLKKLEPKEADRRLQLKLAKGVIEGDHVVVPSITRFEVADALRANTLALLPRDQPWATVVDPVAVASALESFLVEEVPANPPDFELLKPLGADAVLEFVIEDYGMRSDGGRAGVYLVGYGRLFFLEGGGNKWFRSFRLDDIDSGQPHLDPFKVAKDPGLFRDRLTAAIKAVAEVFAKDLTPPERRPGGNYVPRGNDEQTAPKRLEKKNDHADDLPE